LKRQVIFDTDPSPDDIECLSPLTSGASVIDWVRVSGKSPNALVLRSIDAEAYFRLIFRRLLRF
jgi:purine nucleosidase